MVILITVKKFAVFFYFITVKMTADFCWKYNKYYHNV